MDLVCTYCSAPKRRDPGPLPAVERYLSPRITGLHETAQREGRMFRILSGHYGLVAPDAPLDWYDHLLQPDEVSAMVPAVAAALTRIAVSRVIYHSANPAQVPAIRPYLEVMQQACNQAGVTLEIIFLPGDPV